MIPDVLDKQQALFRRNLNHFASLRSYAQLPLNRPALAFLRLFKQQILKLQHGAGDRAYYRPSTDSIHLPFEGAISIVILIVDLDLGNRSVTNDIKSVLRKIEHITKARLVVFGSCIAIRRAF